MVDTVFDIRHARIHETMALIKLFEPGLRANTNRLASPLIANGSDRALNQNVTQSTAPGCATRDHTPDAGLRELHARTETTCICDQLVASMALQMQGLRVRPIEVLKQARLLKHEHFTAQLQQGIQLVYRQRIESREPPMHLTSHKNPRAHEARTARST